MTKDNLLAQRKVLHEERMSVWNRMQEIAFEDGGLSNEDREAYDTAEARLDTIEGDVARIDRQIERADKEAAAAEKRAELLTAVNGDVVTPERVIDEDKRYEQIFGQWLRGGMSSIKPEHRTFMENRLTNLDGESRALSVGVTTAGGFTVPEGFYAQIQEAIAQFGGIRNAGVFQLTTGSGNDLPVPTGDDTGNTGELLGENTAAAEQDTTFGQKVLKSYVWSSKLVKVSLQLLNDSAFDIEAYLAAVLGKRIGRVQATYFISGTGTGQPEGILTNATSGKTAASATTFTYPELVELEHSIDPAYRQMGEYIISDQALSTARRVLDADNRPIWQAGGSVPGVPSTINGYKYTVDIGMPAVTAGLTPVLFGDVSKYWIRDVQGIQAMQLRERYAEALQVGFLAFSRSDGRPVDAGDDPYKVLTML